MLKYLIITLLFGGLVFSADTTQLAKNHPPAALQRMDSNHEGIISKNEVKAYNKKLSSKHSKDKSKSKCSKKKPCKKKRPYREVYIKPLEETSSFPWSR